MYKRFTFPGLILSVAVMPIVSGCTQTPAPPDCPDTLVTSPAKSAGCLAVHQHRLLVVQGINQKISIPGGSGNPQEPAHCTAHRETWEETGLNVRPTKLVRVFDNGFHLFECQWGAEVQAQQPPKQSEVLDTPPFFLEIRQAMWLNSKDFAQYEWRFPEQREWLQQLTNDTSH
ncbi:NUDIX hydrolase [Aestuariicella hydrocarbonica]|uniref:NUDIX hydrolase n=1 Tax=Pseudomaricurvus hydrocarbonicus TaxID=1470433 RepID=A0A9E5JSD1_9GAMM|nr:NUDIX hydrolase [Aestuariicella hydrocarbonica]NHO64501.1 NUDIX hydrolase [Aestuariicella hydrocarbonica]